MITVVDYGLGEEGRGVNFSSECVTVPARVRRRPAIEAPLGYFTCDAERARQILGDRHGRPDYGRKHDESRFTKYQDIYLPRKVTINERGIHLSGPTVSGHLTRGTALAGVARTPIVDRRAEAKGAT